MLDAAKERFSRPQPSCTMLSPIICDLFLLVTNHVESQSFDTCKSTENYLEILRSCFRVVFRENPSECITGVLTAHPFLTGLCAFMVFYIKCKLRLGTPIHGNHKIQINIPKWIMTLILSLYTCYSCQRMSTAVSASLDYGFFSA